MENAKLSEAYKLLFHQNFVTKEDRGDKECAGEDVCSEEDNQHTDSSNLVGPGSVLHPDSQYCRKMNIRAHLKNYLMQSEQGISEREEESCLGNDVVSIYGAIKRGCGDDEAKLGSLLQGTSNRTRANYFVAAEYDGGPQCLRVFYGRVLLYLRYSFSISGKTDLYLSEWLRGIKKDFMGQVSSQMPLEKAFGNPSLEELSTIARGVGMFNHYDPDTRRNRAFVIDTQLRAQYLLDGTRCSSDGINRYIDGLVN